MFTVNFIFYRHGCNVAIASRNFAKLQSAQSALQKAVPGAECFIAQMDVRKVDIYSFYKMQFICLNFVIKYVFKPR